MSLGWEAGTPVPLAPLIQVPSQYPGNMEPACWGLLQALRYHPVQCDLIRCDSIPAEDNICYVLGPAPVTAQPGLLAAPDRREQRLGQCLLHCGLSTQKRNGFSMKFQANDHFALSPVLFKTYSFVKKQPSAASLNAKKPAFSLSHSAAG